MQAGVLRAVAHLKLILTIRHYRRQWGNACSLAAMLFAVCIGAIIGGVTLYLYCQGSDVSARDQAFSWAAWILAAMWLLTPLMQFDSQRQLDLSGLRLVPLSSSTFTAAVLIDGVLSPLGLLFVPLLLTCLICFSRNYAELGYVGLSLLLMMTCLVALGQAVYLWASRLLASRRFADIVFFVGALLFVILQSLNIYFQSDRSLVLPLWVHDVAYVLHALFTPLLTWLFPGLAWRATAAASGGDVVLAAQLYGLLAGQVLVCCWLAGAAARQFYMGELESGGEVKKPVARRTRKGRSLIGGALGALFHRERIYLLRDPVLKRLFFQTMVGVLYFSMIIVVMGYRQSGMPEGYRHIISTYGLLGMSIMLAGMESGMLFNKFGYDGGLLVSQLLTPLDRRRLLQAKSLFLLTHFASVNLVFIIGLAIALKTPILYACTAALMVCANTAVVDVIGNFVSIYYPFTFRRQGTRIRAVMPQPGCGYVFLYSIVWQACNLAVLPASAALALGAIFGGAAGMLIGAAFAAVIVVLAYRWGIPAAAQLMLQREGQLIEILTRSTD